MTVADYMYQEKLEEEDLPALKTALMHRYNDTETKKTTQRLQKRSEED